MARLLADCREFGRKCTASAVDAAASAVYNGEEYTKGVVFVSLGSNLCRARRKSGLSQEAVAEKLGVSRQTISKWETDETLPDIRQSKRMAALYKLSLDQLIDFDLDVQEVQEAIVRTSDAVTDKIDWTKAWGKKYPVLLSYPETVDPAPYARELARLLDRMKEEYGYSELDAMLVLKDILAKVWQARKRG